MKPTRSALGALLRGGILAIALAAPAAATTLTIHPTGASAVDYDEDGDFDFLFTDRLGMGLRYFFGTREERTVLEFDLSGIPPGSQIEEARFFAVDDGGTGGPPSVEVWRYEGDGVVTPDDAEQLSAFVTGLVMDGAPVDFEVTSHVIALVGTRAFLGLVFRDLTDGTFRELYRNAPLNPRIRVEFTAPTSFDEETWGAVKERYRGP